MQIHVDFDNTEEFIAFLGGKLKIAKEAKERLEAIGALRAEAAEEIQRLDVKPVKIQLPADSVIAGAMPVPPVQTPEAPAPIIPTAAPAQDHTGYSIPMTAPAPAAPAVPDDVMTVERLTKAAQFFMDAAKTPMLREMLNSFGVPRVSDLKPDQLEAFAAAMREKGATV